MQPALPSPAHAQTSDYIATAAVGGRPHAGAAEQRASPLALSSRHSVRCLTGRAVPPSAAGSPRGGRQRRCLERLPRGTVSRLMELFHARSKHHVRSVDTQVAQQGHCICHVHSLNLTFCGTTASYHICVTFTFTAALELAIATSQQLQPACGVLTSAKASRERCAVMPCVRRLGGWLCGAAETMFPWECVDGELCGRQAQAVLTGLSHGADIEVTGRHLCVTRPADVSLRDSGVAF